MWPRNTTEREERKRMRKRKRDLGVHRGVWFWWRMPTSAHRRRRFWFWELMRGGIVEEKAQEPWVPASGHPLRAEVSAGEPAEEPAAAPRWARPEGPAVGHRGGSVWRCRLTSPTILECSGHANKAGISTFFFKLEVPVTMVARLSQK